MRRFVCCTLMFCCLSRPVAATVERWVTSAEDNQGEGTLRTILHHACDTDEDDLIRFYQTRLPEIRILLNGPLVIPADCNGPVMVIGSDQVETILDARLFADEGRAAGDNCTLNIYSDGHTIINFTFSGNTTGAGVCSFGRANTIQANRFGTELGGAIRPNRYGVIVYDIFQERDRPMDGSGNAIVANDFGPTTENAIVIHADANRVADNQIRNTEDIAILLMGHNNTIHRNTIRANFHHGIWVKAHSGQINANTIVGNGGCPTAADALPGQPIDCQPNGSGAGAGIFIADGASDVTIGGPKFSDDANTIRYNRGGGVIFQDGTATHGIAITHNRIAMNYGAPSAVDFFGDGVTRNDLADLDEGPNTLFNFPEHLQSFPLVPSPTGAERYWTWGVAFDGARVELYDADPIDLDIGRTHGGSVDWATDRLVKADTFQFQPVEHPLTAGDVLTPLAFDTVGNTSEFGVNARVGPDLDLDGIVDVLEQTSAPGNADTDADGLPDSVEDANRNGVWDVADNETSAAMPDSDLDGVSDWSETHGDGHYESGIDTNPLIIDSDGDGRPDGAEDFNGNGIWDGYLGETSPFLTDSDDDGFGDDADSCPIIPNPGQEPWYCEGNE